MEDYAGRILADRYRLPLPPSDEYELIETRAFDTRSGQEVLVRQVPLPEVVDAELLDGARVPGGGPATTAGGRRAPAELPAVRRAIAAAQAAASVPDHPRLDQVFDVFAEGGSLWIVSELVPARPLAALIADEPLSPYRAAEVASDVLTALRVLHAHGWTHRNITTRTVLICEDGRVVLTGLAAGAAEEALCGYDPVPAPDDEGFAGSSAAHPEGGADTGPAAGGGYGPDAGPEAGYGAAALAAGPGDGSTAGRPAGYGTSGTTRSAGGPEAGTGPAAAYGAGAASGHGAGADSGSADGAGAGVVLRGADAGPGHTTGSARGAGAAQYAPLVAPGYDTGPRYSDHITPGNGGERPDPKAAARAGAIAAYRAGAQAAARVAEQRKAGVSSAEPVAEPRPEGSTLPQGYSYPYGGPDSGAAWHGATPRRRALPPAEEEPQAAPPAQPDPAQPHPVQAPPAQVRPGLPAQLALPQGYRQAETPDGSTAPGYRDHEPAAGSGPPPASGYGQSAPGGAPPASGYGAPQTARPRKSAEAGAALSASAYDPPGPRADRLPVSGASGYGQPRPGGPVAAASAGEGSGYGQVGRAGVAGGWGGGRPRSGLDAERARQTRMAVVGAVTERWSPEQAQAVHGPWQLAAPVGPATDLWGLGALLYRAVQGHAPYPEDSVAELVEMVCAEPPAFAEECGPLRPVVESLLRQDPTERPDFEELRGWLRSLVRSAPEPDGGFAMLLPPPAPDPARLPVVRRRADLHGRHRSAEHPRKPRSLGRSLLLGILVLLAGAVAYAMFFMPRSADPQGQGKQNDAGPGPSASQEQRPGQTKGQGQSQSASPRPSASPPESKPAPQTNAPAPPGYTVQQDAEHFEIAVPNGWDRRGINESGQVRYTEGEFALTVVPGRDKAEGNPDPATYQKDKEPELAPYRSSTWSSVGDIKSTKVGNQLRVTGRYTWIDGNGRSVVARNFVVALGGSYHVVLVTGPQDQEGKVTEVFEKATASYKTGG